MKKYIHVLTAFTLLLCSCEKEMIYYEGDDSLYFDVRSEIGAHEFYTAVPFGATQDNSIDIVCNIMTTGYPKDYDREFKVIVNSDSTTAIVGREYDPIEENYVIKAGETGTSIKLTLYRSQEIYNDTMQLQLQLKENEHFKTLFTNYVDNPGNFVPSNNAYFSNNHSANIHNIYIYDVVTQPKGWWKGLWGDFSAKKWRLMMEITDTRIEDYNDILVTMPMMRAQAIDEKFGKYLIEMAESKETVVLEDDGTMMYTKSVKTLGGSAAWTAGTTPEEYYQ